MGAVATVGTIAIPGEHYGRQPSTEVKTGSRMRFIVWNPFREFRNTAGGELERIEQGSNRKRRCSLSVRSHDITCISIILLGDTDLQSIVRGVLRIAA